MIKGLTICYVSARKEAHIEWFSDSLKHQFGAFDGNAETGLNLAALWIDGNEKRPLIDRLRVIGKLPIQNISPKPSVWQGPHRLTTVDFFDQSNARNTAIINCRTSHIAFVDDLSVLGPLWLKAALEATKTNSVYCGAFRKVKKLVVEDGNIISYEGYPGGVDPRWSVGNDDRAVPCAPQWFFGCSVVLPLDALLKVNGYPEDWTAGMGYEDCITGSMIHKHGYRFFYDRRLMTYESEEDHHNQEPLKRIDPGVSPLDKSHAILELEKTHNTFPNYFGDGIENITMLRSLNLNGTPPPIRTAPTREWFSGWWLSEFHNYKPPQKGE